MERIEATPDTVITLVDGSRHVVAESVEVVVDRVRHFRASVVAMSQRLEHDVIDAGEPDATGPTGTTPALRLIAQSSGDV